MTDDSKAEKNALKSLWPTSKQFLCHFHMAQAEWRWLHDNKNRIKLLDRLPLMRKFQKVKIMKVFILKVIICLNISSVSIWLKPSSLDNYLYM